MGNPPPKAKRATSTMQCLWIVWRLCVWLSHDGVVSVSEDSSTYHCGKKPKRMRTAFSANQLLQLDEAFRSNQYLVGQQRRDLASSLNLTETQVNCQLVTRRRLCVVFSGADP